MKKFTRKQFEKLAQHGSVRKGTNKVIPGEDLCETWLEYGIANGYSLADMCHFYVHVQCKRNERRAKKLTQSKLLNAAHEMFVLDALVFGATIMEAAPKTKRLLQMSNARHNK